jgi:hypothetical protein
MRKGRAATYLTPYQRLKSSRSCTWRSVSSGTVPVSGSGIGPGAPVSPSSGASDAIECCTHRQRWGCSHRFDVEKAVIGTVWQRKKAPSRRPPVHTSCRTLLTLHMRSRAYEYTGEMWSFLAEIAVPFLPPNEESPKPSVVKPTATKLLLSMKYMFPGYMLGELFAHHVS